MVPNAWSHCTHCKVSKELWAVWVSKVFLHAIWIWMQLRMANELLK